MKVAFLLLHYPVFSETFVTQEILNLQQLGVDGLIVCEKQITKPPFHPQIKQIKYPIHLITPKIFGPQFLSLLNAHFYWLIRNPIGYFQSIVLFIKFFSYHHLRVFIKAPLLAKKIKDEKINLLYVHEVDSPSLFGLICSRLCHLPCGIIIHTQYLFAQNRFLAAKISSANFTIFQSKYSQQQAKSITHLPSKYFKSSHILSTPGIDTDFFKPSPTHHFSSFPKIISIGRLEEAKGFPILLESVKILKKYFPNILLTIVGDGSQKTLLQNYIDQNKLSANVKLTGFIGHIPKLIKLIQSHDYFVLPSITDSQKVHDVHPNVIKEAMSAGLIVITSRLGGITEIIKNKNNGFLVDKATPENFAKAIKSVHSLSNSRKEITSAAARLTILQHHQQKIICSRLKEIFSLYEKK